MKLFWGVIFGIMGLIGMWACKLIMPMHNAQDITNIIQLGENLEALCMILSSLVFFCTGLILTISGLDENE